MVKMRRSLRRDQQNQATRFGHMQKSQERKEKRCKGKDLRVAPSKGGKKIGGESTGFLKCAHMTAGGG